MKFLKKVVSVGVSCCMLLHATPINFIVPSQITAGSFTISSPGTYLLVDDTTFSPAVSATAITISANNVTLDLNGKHLIGGNGNAAKGIDLPASRNDIIIKNGIITDFLAGVDADTGTTYTVIILEDLTIKNKGKVDRGISFVNASDCIVRRCNCSGGSRGARFATSSRIQIIDSTFNDNALFGLEINSCESFNVSNCQTNFTVDDGPIGTLINSSRNCTFSNCAFNGNLSVGGGVVLGAQALSSRCILFSNCEFCGNSSVATSDAAGLDVQASTGVVVRNCLFNDNNTITGIASGVLFSGASHGNYFESCIAADNFSTGAGAVSGFDLRSTASNNTFDTCKALRNRSGTSTSIGFSLVSTTTANIFKNCEAYNNKGGGGANIGFFDGNSGTGLGTNTYYGCVASKNTVNFSSSIATSTWSYGPGTFSPAVTNLPGTFYNVSIIA